ncbi:hypothetical protein DNTS_015093, partial [Danionella cerebrum]
MPFIYNICLFSFMKSIVNGRQNMLLILALLFQSGFQDTGCTRSTGILSEVKKVRLHEALTLNCIYNCSSGFSRGSWRWEDTPECSQCHWKSSRNKSGEMCIVSISTPRVMMEQTQYNYTCVSEKTDHPSLLPKTERLVTLQVHDESEEQATHPEGPADRSLRVIYRIQKEPEEVCTSVSIIEVKAETSLSLHCGASTNTTCALQWVRENSSLPFMESNIEWDKIKADDSGRYTCQAKGNCTEHHITVEVKVIPGDELTWVKVFAGFALSAMVVLVANLVYLCRRRGCERMDSTEPVRERISSRSGVVLTPIPQDSQSDHEVSYADIVISVRRASNPDLSDTFNQTSKNLR